MKNKKSSLFFMPLLVIISLIILIDLYLVLSSKNAHLKYPIGERQFDLLKTYVKAESTLLFIDQSAKYSLQQSIYELAQNGGISDIYDSEEIDTSGESYNAEIQPQNQCGKFRGANIWYSLEKDENNEIKKTECFDESSLTINFESLFNKNLNDYLIKHPENILTNNYDYEIKDNLEIIGRAIAPLKFYILKDEAKQFGIEPSEIIIEGTEKIEDALVSKVALKEPKKTQNNFIDFTGTALCAKGTKCIVTKEAYDVLLKAQEAANQKGTSLEVTSAYRSIEAQKILWERNPNSNLVCPPSPTCPHTTGKVVDIRFKGKTFGTMTNTEWSLLHEIMSQAGWVRYANENWHFECCGTKRYELAKEKGVTAIV